MYEVKVIEILFAASVGNSTGKQLLDVKLVNKKKSEELSEQTKNTESIKPIHALKTFFIGFFFSRLNFLSVVFGLW